MEIDNFNSLINSLEDLNYENKFSIYNRIFSLGNFESGDISAKLVLISLLALTYSKMKEKNPTITPLQILIQITGKTKDDSSFYQFLESVSILVQDMSYGCTKFDTCGCKTSQEIINKIKEILNTWIPF